MDNSNQPSSSSQNPPAGNTPTPPPVAIPTDTGQAAPTPWPQAPSANPFPNYQATPTLTPDALPPTPTGSDASVMAAYPPSQTPGPADSFWANPAAAPANETAAPTWPPMPQQNPVAPVTEQSTPLWANSAQPEPPQATPTYTSEISAPSFVPPASDTPVPAPDNTNLGNQPSQYMDPNMLAASNAPSSPLDNPYGVPAQAPSINIGPLNQPASPGQAEPPWATSAGTTPAAPSFAPAADINPQPAAATAEQAPTDLSHLISNADSNTEPPPVQPETLVMPQPATPEVPNIPTETKGGIPKWVIGLGAGLLIIVAGASAYFILGIGQTPKNTSLPATEPPKVQQQVSTPAPIIPTPTPQPAATGSANFGDLQGSGTAPQASSAADILKARQQQSGR